MFLDVDCGGGDTVTGTGREGSVITLTKLHTRDHVADIMTGVRVYQLLQGSQITVKGTTVRANRRKVASRWQVKSR
jgi:hypothetical protein